MRTCLSYLSLSGEAGSSELYACSRRSDIRGANVQWATATGRLLRAFIAFRIETPSGNIFPWANLIKARRTGLLNEQIVAGTAACGYDGAARRWPRRHWQVAARRKQMQFYASVFLISLLSSRAAPTRRPFRPAPPRKYPPQEESLIFRTFSPLVSASSRGEMNSAAKRARRVRNIY